MPVPSAYLTNSKNAKDILDAMQRAGVPSRFTYEFLKQLGYPSSSDRPFIAVLKAFGFLTDTGEPTDRYRRYKDPSQSKAVLAEAMREAYVDLFSIDQQANAKTTNELKGMFARLSDKGDSVTQKMATTFKTFAELADFKSVPVNQVDSVTPTDVVSKSVRTKHEGQGDIDGQGALTVHHDIHIHLPESTNIEVYDAIFRSLREHLA